MKTIFTAYLRVYATGMLCTFLSLTSTVTAQTDLVKWDGFTFGPPVSATSFLPMNSGKELTNGGQSNGAFVGNAGTSSGHVLIANGWDAGNYFQVNFATSNYTSNTITFLLGAFAGGAKHFKMQYALSSGGPFIDFGSSMNFGNDGGENVESWNLPAACINQPDVYIRITSTSGSTISGGGNYIDNITVAGTAMAAASITQQPTIALLVKVQMLCSALLPATVFLINGNTEPIAQTLLQMCLTVLLTMEQPQQYL